MIIDNTFLDHNTQTGVLIGNQQIFMPTHLAHTLSAITERTQAPNELALSSMLSAMSLVGQGLIDVKLPISKVCPVSLYLITIAPSGERKSTVENLTMNKIYQIEQEQSERTQRERELYKTRHDIWEARYKKETKKLANSKDEPTDEELHALANLKTSEPKLPQSLRFIYDDTTPAALLIGMSQNCKYAGLISSEGGSILQGQGLRDLPAMNALWSGDSLHKDRTSSDSFRLDDARLTVGLFTQPESFQSYLNAKGDRARGSGFMARTLICAPATNIGQRFLAQQTNNYSMNWFYNQTENLMSRLIDNLDQPRQVLEFDDNAQYRWKQEADRIEFLCQPNNILHLVPDMAAKMAENIARIAGLIHLFVHGTNQTRISITTLESAIAIAMFYANEFLRIMNPVPELSQDANLLINWLMEKVTDHRNGIFHLVRYIPTNGSFVIKKNSIKQYGPNMLRGNRMTKTIDYLISNNIMFLIQHHDPKNTAIYLQLNSNNFGQVLYFNPYGSW